MSNEEVQEEKRKADEFVKKTFGNTQIADDLMRDNTLLSPKLRTSIQKQVSFKLKNQEYI